jgi:hypothetical protein
MSVANFNLIHDTYHAMPQRIFDHDWEQNLKLNEEELHFEIIDASWEYLHSMAEINRVTNCQDSLAGIILLLGHLSVNIMNNNFTGSQYEEAYDCLSKSVSLLTRICIKKLQPIYSPEQIKEKMAGVIQYWIAGSFPLE